MTTIATDGRTIAADGRRTRGNELVDDDCQKLRVQHGNIYALTGDAPMFDVLVEWHASGADPDKVPKISGDAAWTLIVVDREGLSKFSHICPYRERMPVPMTFGSGADYARAAMALGKSPREAVEIAARFDVYTGGEIQVIDIAAVLASELQAAAE